MIIAAVAIQVTVVVNVGMLVADVATQVIVVNVAMLVADVATSVAMLVAV